MSIDYKKVAETLRFMTGCMCSKFNEGRIAEAIALCEQMARGELVERELVWSWTTPDGRYVLSGGKGPGTPPQDPSEADIARKWMDAQSAEREHCERVAHNESTPYNGNGNNARVCYARDLPAILLRERAAADKAGYERGRADQAHATEQYIKDELADRDRRIAELERELADINDRARERGEHAE